MRTLETIDSEITGATNRHDTNRLLTLADELLEHGTPKAFAMEAYARGWAEQLVGSYTEALVHYKRAVALHEELGNRAGIASSTGNIGIVHFLIGNYAQALEHYERAMTLHEELGDRYGFANAISNIGSVYGLIGDYPRALEQYERALALHKEADNQASLANVTCNIGLVYQSTGDYPRALEQYERSLALLAEGGNHTAEATVTTNIGSVYFSTGDYAQALEHYERALGVHIELGDRAAEVHVICSVTELMLKQENFTRALELLEQQAEMQMDDPSARIQHFTQRATIAEHNDDVDAALKYLQSALQVAKEAGLRNHTAGVHMSLRDLAQKRNDFADFIEHNAEYLRITEEVRGKEATQKMAIMEAQRGIEAERRERDKERALLYGALPETVANRMLRGEAIEDHFENAAVLFTDIVGFTTHTSSMHPSETIKLLEDLFKHFDAICAEYGVVKVKTIGDSYLCFAGSGNGEQGTGNGEAQRVALVAVEMMAAEFYWPTATATATANSNSNRIQLRIGIHSGPVSAGVIGTQRLQYDVWGDTVNVASRMESTGEAGRIQVSSAFAEQLLLLRSVAENDGPANSNSQQQPKLTERGEVSVKGKGTMTTYWLEGA